MLSNKVQTNRLLVVTNDTGPGGGLGNTYKFTFFETGYLDVRKYERGGTG